jgi:hypothetical protein
MKALTKLEIEGMYLNIIKGVYDKTIAYVILNWEKLQPFSLKSRTKQGFPLSPLIQNNLGIPNQSNKTGRSNKRK